MILPKIKLGGKFVSRLILGGNPISGFSHISLEKDREMADYHTTSNIKSALDECLRCGIDTFQSRGDRHQMRVLREYYNEGKYMQWIAQTASELRDITSNLKQIVDAGAIAIYHHGTHTDNLWHTGQSGVKEVEDNLKRIRDTGLTVGLGTHRPEIIDYIEDKGWDVDFYMVSFYNLAKDFKNIQAVNGFKKEEFDDSDIGLMIKRIKQTKKTCLVFKILGAGRKSQTGRDLAEAFEYAFENIKPIDAVVVGMYQKCKNQIRENAEIVGKFLQNNHAPTQI